LPAVFPAPAPADLTELCARYHRQAFTLARRILGDDVLAEDVVQEVLLSAWLKPSGYEPSRGTFSSWLMSMVHHKAVDAVRREQSQRDRQARAQRDLTAAPLRSIDVEDAVCDRAVAERVRAALSALPDAQRQALALAYYSGFTQREIASLTGTPLGTVKTRMRAGMLQLRRALHEVGDTLGPALADA
jgi:RNA polymerase sigma factor (sigma-70 family)